MTDELPEIVASERVYEGRYFQVDHATVRFPNGAESDRVTVVHPGAVALVAVDEQGRILLVEQYRHATHSRMLEVPAGTREPGEEPAVTARRELREETGYDADSIVRIGGAWMAPGFTSEYIDFYLATGLRHAPLDGDEEDLGDPIPTTLEELESAIASGEMEDAKTVVALAFYSAHLPNSGPPRGG